MPSSMKGLAIELQLAMVIMNEANLICAGNLKLRVPRIRDGKFHPLYSRGTNVAGKDLLSSLFEMYVSGVSTRKVT